MVHNVKKEVKALPYVVARKKLQKGQFAPKGSIFLVVRAKIYGQKISTWLLIKGGQGEDFEKAVAENMYKKILDKYKVPGRFKI